MQLQCRPYPDRQLNLFPGLLVAPNAKAFAALIDRSIHYQPPAPGALRYARHRERRRGGRRAHARMQRVSPFVRSVGNLDGWTDGLTVGEAYQRLINAIVDNNRFSPDMLVLRNGTAATRPEVQRRNLLLYVIIGDPALQPLQRISVVNATKKLPKENVKTAITTDSAAHAAR